MGETELARMVVRLMGDSTSYISMLRGASTTTAKTTQFVQQQAMQIHGYQQSLIGFASQVKFTLLSSLGILSLFGAGLAGLGLAAQSEKMAVDFGTMLQSTEKGTNLIKKLQDFAAETPLGLTDLTQATKLLLQFGAATDENVIPVLRRLGDVTGGDSQRLRQMSLAFGQMSSTGRLMGQDLNQMINAGFNPLREISRTTGKSIIELKKQMEKGLITTEMVANAFKTATSAGGDFNNGMLNASKTLDGLWSTLKDDISAVLRTIGQQIIDAFNVKQIIKDMSSVAQEAKKWIESIGNGLMFLKDNITVVIQANRGLIITIIEVIGALAGLWVAFKAGGIVIGITAFTIGILRLNLIASIVLWAGWKMVVLASRAAVALYGATVVAVNAAMTASTFVYYSIGFAVRFLIDAYVAARAFVASWGLLEVFVNTVLAIKKLIMLGVTAAIWMYNVAVTALHFAYALFTGSVSLSSIAVGIWGGIVLIAKGITWLWNAALTVMNALLSPITLAAVAAALIVIVSVIMIATIATSAFAAGIYSVFMAGMKAVNVIRELVREGGGLREPLRQVTSVFTGWDNAISNVFSTMQTDFKLAWKFMVAYAELGIAQIQAVWPPLWNFIKTSSSIIWVEITNEFKKSFHDALLAIYDGTITIMLKIANAITSAMNPLTAGVWLKDMLKGGDDGAAKELGEAMGVDMGRAWQLKMKDAVNQFQEEMKNIDLTGAENAKKKIKGLEFEKGQAAFQRWIKSNKEALKLGNGEKENPAAPVAESAKKAVEHIERLQGLLAGSNEGFQRIMEQRDMMQSRMTARTPVDERGMPVMKMTEEFLKQIAKNTAQLKVNQVNIALPANI